MVTAPAVAWKVLIYVAYQVEPLVMASTTREAARLSARTILSDGVQLTMEGGEMYAIPSRSILWCKVAEATPA
jgi:hypothetical protein